MIIVLFQLYLIKKRTGIEKCIAKTLLFDKKMINETKSAIRKPEWLKVRGFGGAEYAKVNALLSKQGLHTVCQSANCPNRGECFNRGTATFLILGPKCTRNCHFCDINPGRPSLPDPTEPERVANTAQSLKLKHVVITSVTRDDLPDGGLGHFKLTVQAVKRALPESTVEILTPDFRGVEAVKKTIAEIRPDIFNHNIETVPRLYPQLRPAAEYNQSLNLLQDICETGIVTKSGLMVGVSESFEELKHVFDDLATAGVKILTIGQYLAPSKEHYPVYRYLHPDEFVALKQMAIESGIEKVYSAPLVRSSYRAEEAL